MTTTLEEFTTALDKAFASVSEEDLNKLLASWGQNEESVKARLKEQFNSWPDVFKYFDPEHIINVEIDEDSVGRHQFLSFSDCGVEGVTDLSNIDLRDVDLHMFKLTGINLTGADLRDALLRSADMDDTNLEGARLDGARLEMADLKGAKGLVDKNQNSKLTFGHDTGTVTIDERTELPSDLLCCYFNPRLYKNDDTNTGFIDNPTTFEDFAYNFVQKYRYASDPIVTPPGSTLNLKVSGHMEAWVATMLEGLQNAWDERETEREAAKEAVRDEYDANIDEFMASLRAKGRG